MTTANQNRAPLAIMAFGGSGVGNPYVTSSIAVQQK
jgi:hypothetical protein